MVLSVPRTYLPSSYEDGLPKSPIKRLRTLDELAGARRRGLLDWDWNKCKITVNVTEHLNIYVALSYVMRSASGAHYDLVKSLQCNDLRNALFGAANLRAHYVGRNLFL